MIRLSVDFGMISITAESDGMYPDIIDDLHSRSIRLLHESVVAAQTAGWCPFDFEVDNGNGDSR